MRRLPSKSSSMASASSSDDVQPVRRELFPLEVATSFNAERIASACTPSPVPSSKLPKLPRLGDKDPAIIGNIQLILVAKLELVEDNILHKLHI